MTMFNSIVVPSSESAIRAKEYERARGLLVEGARGLDAVGRLAVAVGGKEGDGRGEVEHAARALEGLHTIAHQSRTHAMAVLASLGRWNEASERFLRRPPRSPADARLWSLTADVLATCLHSFARVDHAVLPSGSMKTLMQIARDVIVPLASVGAPMGGDAETDVVEDPPALRHPIAA